MCGLVGIGGRLEFKDEATMKRLLVYDYFRGPDSTGLAAINKLGDEVKIAKVASHPFDLFDMTRFTSALSGYKSSAFIGHNRSATRGAVNGVNAHPYEVDHIVGAHNGTLSAGTFAKLSNKLGEKFDVDSQAIFASIARLGAAETIALFQESVEGKQCPDAWALVWFDMKEKTLNFLRNKERPLWYAYTKEFDRIVWASEWPMIDAAIKLSAQGYELYVDPDKGYRFWAFPEDIHVKFDVKELSAGSTDKPKPIVKELKGKAASQPVVSATSGSDPFGRYGHNTRGKTKTSTTTFRGIKDTVSTVVHLFGSKTAPFAGFITRERFDEIAKYGCSWCGADVDFEDVGVSVFERDDTILCPTCGNGDKGHNRVYTTDLEGKLKANK